MVLQLAFTIMVVEQLSEVYLFQAEHLKICNELPQYIHTHVHVGTHICMHACSFTMHQSGTRV